MKIVAALPLLLWPDKPSATELAAKLWCCRAVLLALLQQQPAAASTVAPAAKAVSSTFLKVSSFLGCMFHFTLATLEGQKDFSALPRIV